MVDGQRDWLTFYERCQYRTYYWKVVVPGEFPFDVRRIHPWQQKYVTDIYNVLKTCESVSKVILFGSSIEPYCTMQSDIDLAYEGDITPVAHSLYQIAEYGLDLVKLPVTNLNLQKDIEKGLRLI